MKTLLHNSFCKINDRGQWWRRDRLFNNYYFPVDLENDFSYTFDERFDRIFLSFYHGANILRNTFIEDQKYEYLSLEEKIYHYYLDYEWEEMRANEDEDSFTSL